MHSERILSALVTWTMGGRGMAEFSIQKFEESGRENGVKYWYAHDFMPSLGYETWASFQSVITKAMASCARLGIDPTESFSAETVLQNGREIRTYRLSRFACLLVSMHADSKKPEVAKAKAALAAIADQLIEERIQEQDLGRIEARDDLKLAERVMSSTAREAGLDPTGFGIFKDAGFRGMYNMSLQQLMAHKGVGRNNTLYDYMGLEELAGNLFRVTQTSARIRSQGVRGMSQLTRTAQQVGSEVRDMMIKNGGTAPELLPIEDNVAKIKKRLKSAAREMKKLDGKKPRKPAKGPRD